MQHMKQHFLRFLILVCMIVCIFTVSAFAEESGPVSEMTDMGTDMVTSLIDFNAGIAQDLIQGGADMASGLVRTATGGMVRGDLIQMAAGVTSDLVGTGAELTKNAVSLGMSIPSDAAGTLTDAAQGVVSGINGNGTDIIGSLAESVSGIADANAQNISGLADSVLNAASSTPIGNGLTGLPGTVLSHTAGLISSANSGLANMASGAVNDLVSTLTSSSLAGNMAGGIAGTGLSLAGNLASQAIRGFSGLAQDLLSSGLNFLTTQSTGRTDLLASLLAQGTGHLGDLLAVPETLAGIAGPAGSLADIVPDLVPDWNSGITSVLSDLGSAASETLSSAVRSLSDRVPSDGSALGSLLGSAFPTGMAAAGSSVLEQLENNARTMAEQAVKAAEETTGTAGLVASDFASQLQNILQKGASSAVRLGSDTGAVGEGILEQILSGTEDIGTGSLQNIVEMFTAAGASADDMGGALSSSADVSEESGLSSLLAAFLSSFGNAVPADETAAPAAVGTEEPTLSIYQNRTETEPVNCNDLTGMFLLPGRILSSLAGAALGTLSSLPETGDVTAALCDAGADGRLGQLIGTGLGTMADAVTGAVTGTLLGIPAGAGLGALTGAVLGTALDTMTGALLGSVLASPAGAAAGSMIGGIVGTALLPAKWAGAAAFGTATALLGPAKWIDGLAGAGLGALAGLPMAGILEFAVRPLLILPEAVAALGVSELVHVPMGAVFGPMKWVLSAVSVPLSFIPSMIAGFLGQTAVFPIAGMIGVPLVQFMVWLGTGAITGILTLPVSPVTVPTALVLAAPICTVAVLPLFGFFMTVATVLHVMTYVPVIREMVWTIVGGFVGVPIGALEGSLLGAVVGGVLGASGGFLLAFPGFRIPVALILGAGWGLAAGTAWFFLGGFNGLVIGVIGGFLASLATSPVADLAFSSIVSGIIAALNFGVGTLLDSGIGAALGALVQPLYYGTVRLISNLATDVLAALSMLLPAALGLLPGYLFGTAVDALSGLIPGSVLGSLADAVTGGMIGSPAGALAAALSGLTLGGLLGGTFLPGKWLGGFAGSIPGAVSGGSAGNVLGRGIGAAVLPGKWIAGTGIAACMGRAAGPDSLPAGRSGEPDTPDTEEPDGKPDAPDEEEPADEPVSVPAVRTLPVPPSASNVPVSAPSADSTPCTDSRSGCCCCCRCTCGCRDGRCGCCGGKDSISGRSGPEEESRAETTAAVSAPENDVTETGSGSLLTKIGTPGTAVCIATALLAALILLLLLRTHKKEEP